MPGGAEFFQERFEGRNQPVLSRDQEDTDCADHLEVQHHRDRPALLFVDQDTMPVRGRQGNRSGFPFAQIGIRRQRFQLRGRIVQNERAQAFRRDDSASVREIRTNLRLLEHRARHDDPMKETTKQFEFVQPPQCNQRTRIRDDNFSQTRRAPAPGPLAGSELRECSTRPSGR